MSDFDMGVTDEWDTWLVGMEPVPTWLKAQADWHIYEMGNGDAMFQSVQPARMEEGIVRSDVSAILINKGGLVERIGTNWQFDGVVFNP